MLALAVTASLAAPARAEDAGHVVILRHDGTSYARWSAPGVPNDAPRMALARQFYQSHSDDYDFLVVFPAFPNALVGEAGGLHTGVRSDVAGIGRPYLDRGTEFGSAARLKAFIDVASLSPGASMPTIDEALGVVAHEVGHQWLANVAYRDVVTGLERRDLLGQEGSHWSALLDTDASLLYGADWIDRGDGTFTAAAARRRYSDLDLYLMGLSPASDVAPLTLLHPSAPGAPDPTAVSVADGTTIAAVPERIDLSQIMAAEGPRVPAAGASQAVFRVAFALAVGPGQSPTPEQVAFVDQVRRAWGDTFFVLTRGRGLMQADLTGALPGPSNRDATVARGVEWLMAHQAGDGSWADAGATTYRDTAAAAEALALLGGDARVASAVQRGSTFLSTGEPTDIDSAARRALALAAVGQPTALGGPELGTCAGCGLAYGYAASIIDTALAAQATLVRTGSPSAASGAVAFLLAHQGADGGWPYAPGGPSRIEPTTRVLQVLARAAPTPASAYARSRGADFLEARRTASGLLADDGSASAEATAIGALGLAAAGEGPGTPRSLLERQQSDGSWDGSAYATAQVLQALRLALTPNLSLDPQGVFLSRSLVVEGETVVAQVTVHNKSSLADLANVAVAAYDASGTPFGRAIIPLVRKGESENVSLVLDTAGHAGSDLLFVVVDPDDAIVEWNEADNRVALPFTVEAGPAGVDLFASAGSIASAPTAITAFPAALTVTAQVGNGGRTEVRNVEVVLQLGGLVAGRTFVDLAAGERRTVSFPVVVPVSAGAVPVVVTVDPLGLMVELHRDNNSTIGAIPLVPRVDVAVGGLVVQPAQLERGQVATFTVTVRNAGTATAVGAQVGATIRGANGTPVGWVTPAPIDLAPAESRELHLSWTATAQGPLSVTVQAAHASDADASNDTVTASFLVVPPTAPNLTIPMGGVTLATSPPEVGKATEVVVTVANDGGSAAGPFAVEFLAGSGAVPRSLGEVAVGGLAAGASTTVRLAWTPDSAEDRPIIVRADAHAAVAESEEGDNDSVLDVRPQPIPDLVLTDGDLTTDPVFPRPGTTVRVTVSILNAGGQRSSAAPVELWLGDPASGGRLLGTATLEALAPAARGEVSFLWSTARATGAQTLVALVNSGQVALEQRQDNNRGQRQVLLQVGAVAVGNPYFSPNGDGVKDDTTFAFRGTAGAAAVVQITDDQGRLIRALDVPPLTGEVGSATWDGRDDLGKIARDGDYTVQVAGVGRAQVTLDTNRYPIHEVTDQAMLRVAALKGGGVPDPMGRGLVAFNCGSGGYRDDYGLHPCGFYLHHLEGGPSEQLTSNDWAGDPDNQWPRPFALSPDGRFIAFVSQTNKLRLFSRVDGTTITLATEGTAGIPLWGQLGYDVQSIAFTPDSRRVWFQTGQNVVLWGRDYVDASALESIDIQGGPSRLELVMTGWSPWLLAQRNWDFSLSPDGSAVAVGPIWGAMNYFSTGLVYGLIVSPVTGEPINVWDRGGYLWAEHAGTFPFSDPTRAYVWLSDGTRLIAESYSDYAEPRRALHLLAAPGQVDWAYMATGANLAEIYPEAPLGRPVAHPTEDVVLFVSAAGTRMAAPLGAPLQAWPMPEGGEGAIGFSPDGSFLYGAFNYYVGTPVVSSLANLSGKLTVARQAGRAGVVFSGMATDLHFASYAIRVRPMRSDGQWTTVVQGLEPVIDGELGGWIPIAPGAYEAVLEIRDLAGNATTRRSAIGWADTAVLAGIGVEPAYISPNGDGIQDEAVIRYQAAAPCTVRFEVLDHRSRLVRSFDRTHLQPGSYQIPWDGTDEQGLRVADGYYLVRGEGVAAQVIVDTTPPQAEVLTWTAGFYPSLESLPRVITGSTGDDTPGWRIYVRAEDALELETGRTVEVRKAVFYAGRRVLEEHPADWWMEQGSGGGDFAVLVTSEDPRTRPVGLLKDLTDIRTREHYVRAIGPFDLHEVRGSELRVSARDLAGNLGSSVAVPMPELALLVAAGTPEELGTGSLLVGGEVKPRVDLLGAQFSNTVRVDESGKVDSQASQRIPESIAYQPRRWAFALAHTLAEPVAGYEVSYEMGSIPYVEPPGAVEVLPGDVIVWDGRRLPAPPLHFTVTVRGITGRSVSVEVPFRISAQIDTCMTEAGLRGTVTHAVAEPARDMLMPGATLTFTRSGRSIPETTVTLEPSAPVTVPGDRRETFSLPRAQLPGCDYTVELHGVTLGGAQVEGSARFSACGVTTLVQSADGQSVVLELAETFDAPLASVGVVPVGDHQVVAVIPGFKGMTVAKFPWSRGCDTRFDLVPHFLDPTQDVGQWEFNYCASPATSGACIATHVHVERTVEAACAGRASALTAVIGVDGPVPIDRVTTTIIDARRQGLALPVPTVASGSKWEAKAPLDPSSLAEGTVQVWARYYAAGSPPNALPVAVGLGGFIVDRTPPAVGITFPAPGAKVCPIQERTQNGTLAKTVVVEGFYSDHFLEGFNLSWRAVGTQRVNPLLQRANPMWGLPTVEQGSLAKVPVRDLPLGEVELSTMASDASGASYCSTSRFGVISDSSLNSVAAAPPLFSPDGDGLLDTTVFGLQVEGTAVVAAYQNQGAGRTLLGSWNATGPTSVEWNGSAGDGTRLADGDHELEFVATDVCGALTTITVPVAIDTAPPAVAVTSPLPGERVSGGSAVVAEIADPHLQAWEVWWTPPTGAGDALLVASGAEAVSGPVAALPASPPGDYLLLVRALDAVGHASEHSIPVRVDAAVLLAAVTVSPGLVSPNGDGVLDGTSVGVTLAATATVAVDLVDGSGALVTPLVPTTPLISGAYAFAVGPLALGAVADGEYQVRVQATAAGLVDEQVRPLTLDVLPPVAQFEAPIDGAFVAGRLAVRGLVDDLHPAAWSVGLRDQAGQERELAHGAARASGLLAALDKLSDGPYTVEVQARDAAGNHVRHAVEFTSDSTPPAISFTAPQDREFVASGADGLARVALQLAEANPASVTLEAIDPITGSTHLVGTAPDLASPGLAIAWDLTAEPEGAMLLRATALDRAGNRSQAEIDVTVDTTPPTAQLHAVAGGVVSAAPVTISGVAGDANLDHWSLELGRGPPGLAMGFFEIARGSTAVDGDLLTELVTLPADGLYTVRLRVTDRAGHVATDELGVTVDTLPPAPPSGLVATVDAAGDVSLRWTASPDPDLVQYQILRGKDAQPLVQVGLVPASTTAFRDPAVPDGSYRYAVVAVGVGGPPSVPTPELRVNVDTSVPVASLTGPMDGARVSGMVQVSGRAWARDLHGYRLLVSRGGAPSAEVASGATPVNGGLLGVWDTLGGADGPASVRLEAESASGRLATAEVAVVVDNTPPVRPVLLSATLAGSSVALTWAPNPESDLAGYLVLRNGVPANAPAGADLSDLRKYLLAASATSFTDAGVPDGIWSYEVQAFDTAGNASLPSLPRSVTIDARAPAARLASPANLVRLAGRVTLAAEAADRDVASVRFEVRSDASAPFGLLAVAATPPYLADLDLDALPSPAVEIRAVATDQSGRSDPSPESIVVLRDEPPAPVAIAAVVDAGQVTVGWTDSNPAGLVAGYRVERAGGLLSTSTRPAGTTSATSTASGTPDAVYDQSTGTVWTSAPSLPQAVTVTLATPTVLRSITATPYFASHTADYLVKVRGVWARVAAGRASGSAVVLDPPLEAEAVALQFLTSSRTFVDLAELALEPEPLLAGPPVVDGPLYGPVTYAVTATTPFGLTAAASSEADVFTPTIDSPSVVVPGPTTVVGGWARAGWTVSLLTGGTPVGQGVAGADGHFAIEVPVVAGANDFTAVATSAGGSRSWPSGTFTVTCAPPPAVSIALALDALGGFDASLSFTVTGDAADVSTFRVDRALDAGSPQPLTWLAATDRSFTAWGLGNGSHRFRVVAANAAGFESPPSNEVTVTLSAQPPQPPTGLVVTTAPYGGQLNLAWTPPDSWGGFLVQRADAEVGPFADVGGTGDPSYVDRYLADGHRYFYRVMTLDAGGNPSAPSAVASGVPGRAQATRAPRILQPTDAQTPIVVASGTTTVGGTAEPESLVEVTRNGVLVGRTLAGPGEPQSQETLLAYTVATSVDLTPNGQAAVYGFEPAPGAPMALAVEDLGTHSVRTLAVPGSSLTGDPMVSPDGRRVAVAAFGTGAELQVLDLATGQAERIPTTCVPDRPSWSPDARRVAYECLQGTSTAVGVYDLLARTETVILSDPERDARVPTWSGTATLYAVVSPPPGGGSWQLVEATMGPAVDALHGMQAAVQAAAVAPDAGAVATRILYEDLTLEPVLAASVSGRLAAVVAGDWGDVVIIDTATSVVLGRVWGNGQIPTSLVFSPDELTLAVGSDGVYSVDLATMDATRLDGTGGGEGAMASLRPGAAPITPSPIAAPLALGATYQDPVSPTRLVWRDGYGVLASQWYGSPPVELELAGTFVLEGVVLEAGTNLIAASSQGSQGSWSLPSLPILVTWDVAGAPDLAITAEVVPAMPVAGEIANVAVHVANLGGSESAATAVDVAVLSADGTARWTSRVPVGALPPGAAIGTLVPLDTGPLAGVLRLHAEVDAGHLIIDGDRSNNLAEVPFSVLNGGAIQVAVDASPAAVALDGTFTLTATVANPGLPTDATVLLRIEDPSGALVVAAEPIVFEPLPGAATAVVARPLPVGAALAGAYVGVAEVVQAGLVVARAAAPVTVVADRAVALTVAPFQGQPHSDEAIGLQARLVNLSRNAALSGAVLRIAVSDLAGQPAWSSGDQLVPTLWLGGEARVLATVPPGTLRAGAYGVRATLWYGGQQLAEAFAPLTVAGRVALAGSLVIPGAPMEPPAVARGLVAGFEFAVVNRGDLAAGDVALHLLLSDPDTLDVVARGDTVVGPLAAGQRAVGEIQLATGGLALKTYAVTLAADHDGIAGEVLATGRLRFADPTPPALEVLNPPAGAFVKGWLNAGVRARDDASGTASVTVLVDGSPASLVLQSGSPLDGVWAAPLTLADGPHQLVFLAADEEGNSGADQPRDANPVEVVVVADATPPRLAIGGATDGGVYATAVVPSVDATDANLAAVYAWLDGAPWLPGTAVLADGVHVFAAQAVDRSGNASAAQVQFLSDGTPPVVSILGVEEGAFVRGPVELRVEVAEAHLSGLEVTVNGTPTPASQVLLAEGTYDVVAQAADVAGNTGAARTSFVIDRTAPALSIAGVTDGTTVSTEVVPTFSASDLHLASVAATLNGVPFTSGSTISADGDYLLVVVALDRAGNRSERSVAFVVDQGSSLAVTLGGFVEGSFVAARVAPTYTATGAALDRVEATLDGVPFLSGTPVSADGLHVLHVLAIARSGATAEATGTFTIDQTAPAVSLGGFTDGAHVGANVTPRWQVTDTNLATSSATLDGAPFTSGTIVTAEGAHALVVTGADRAGNQASSTGTFTIDRTAPAISLGGFTDGAYVATSVAPTWQATDANLARTSATLDGAPFTAGSILSSEGAHALVVTATDLAGNQASQTGTFTIDRTAPAISLGGFTDGAYVGTNVTPTWQVTDTNLGTTSANLDGAPFTSGTIVTAEGEHTLVVTGADQAGNQTSRTGTFTIDRTAPSITISGVADGGRYLGTVAPVVAVSDAHPGTQAITLDGGPFTSGTPVSAGGDHLLVVHAVDAAGNAADASVSFTVAAETSTVHQRPGSAFPRVLALIRAGTCAAPAADAARLKNFLETHLGGAGRVVYMTTDEAEFLTRLRSGAYNVFIPVALPLRLNVADDGCGEALEDCDDLVTDAASVRTRKAIARELTELVFSGHAGVVGIRNRPELLPKYRAVLGVDPGLWVPGTKVRFTAAPLLPSSDLTLSRRGVRLRLVGATAAASYVPAPVLGSGAAVALNDFGLGKAVAFGYDPSVATTAADAGQALQRAVAHVTPAGGGGPLAVTGVEIVLEPGTGTAAVTGQAPAPLAVVMSAPAGAVSSDTVNWSVMLSPEAPTVLRLFARLPDQAGSYDLTATATPGGASALSLVVSETGTDLLADARAAAAAMSCKGAEGIAKAGVSTALDAIAARSVTSRAGVEANLASLAAAVANVKYLSSPAAVSTRLALDELVRYWEARW